MPIFEYECSECGHVMEFLEKSAGPHKHTCQKCKSSNLKKLLSGFAVERNTPPPACGGCPQGPCPSSTCPPSCGEF